MYLNADIKNLCILTKQWHITGAWSLLQSCVVIVLFAMLFEFLRERIRRYEAGLGSLQLEGAQGRSASPDRSAIRSARASK
jgi:copper transporter 1